MPALATLVQPFVPRLPKPRSRCKNITPVIFASSAGGYDDIETLETALLVPIDHKRLRLQPAVERAIVAEDLTSKIYLKSDIGLHELDDVQL
jgi:hypothetical protein